MVNGTGDERGWVEDVGWVEDADETVASRQLVVIELFAIKAEMLVGRNAYAARAFV